MFFNRLDGWLYYNATLSSVEVCGIFISEDRIVGMLWTSLKLKSLKF